MAFKKTLEIKKEDGVALEVKPVEIFLTEATALYVKANLGSEDKFTYNPTVQIMRLVDVSNGCEPDEVCVPFCETCTMVFLPEGKYLITACPLDNKYYKDIEDVTISIDLVAETVDKQYKEVLEMNSLKGC